MAILKLKDAGDTATLTITRCEVKAGNFGDQVAFSAGDDVLFVGKDTADRQLLRCGFDVGDYAAVVGSTLRFSREANAKKPGAAPFWNIELSSPGEAKQAATPSKRLAPPARPAKPVVNAFDAMVPDEDMAGDFYPPDWDDLPPTASASAIAPAAKADPAPSVTLTPQQQADTVRYVTLLRDIATLTQLPLDAANVQGAAATLWIQWRGR